MYATLVFDTEDTYYPPKCGIDNIPGWLSEIMTEVGVTGTFFVMGEKVEELLKRGRSDILDKIAQHDVASHQQGNRYPLVPQVVENRGWQGGIEAIRNYEDWVKEQFSTGFNREPVAFSRHNAHFAPQHVGVAGERALPYMYMICRSPEFSGPLWYAGAQTFSDSPETMFQGFDRIYSRTDLFDAHLSQLDSFISKHLEAGSEYVTVFGCHPVQVMGRGWLEHRTLTTGQAKTPKELGWHFDVKPAPEEALAKANFKRLCQYLKDHPDISVVGMEEAGQLFSSQPDHVDRDALLVYASDLMAKNEIVMHSTFSPAELVCGFADSIIHSDSSGDLPASVSRRAVLGPTQRPVLAQETDTITSTELLLLCKEMVAHVEKTGHLPANVTANNKRLGIAQLASVLAKSYLAMCRQDRYEQIAVPVLPRYPLVAYEIDSWIRQSIGDHWAMPLDFSCDDLAEQARLQSWSMKPARLSPETARVPDYMNAARRSLTGNS